VILLDAFGIHAIGGVFGNLMVGFFATDTVYAGYNGTTIV
jgi:ammonia channel protein AmtB